MNDIDILLQQVEDQSININTQIDVQSLWEEMSLIYPIGVHSNGNQIICIYDENIEINSKNGFTRINYLFRHKVSKEKWKVSIHDDFVYVTGDHGVIINRDGREFGCEPKNIKKTDYLVYDNQLILVDNDFVSIERVQDFEDQYVYDLEVIDKSHTFYSNNILLHNSLYVNLTKFISYLFPDQEFDWYNQQQLDKFIDYIDNDFSEHLNDYCADFICKTFHTSERRIEFKREKICMGGDYCSKKHYILKVLNSEGIPCNKFVAMGIDIKKNEIPNQVKNILKDIVESGIEQGFDNTVYQQKIGKAWEIFQKLSIKEIAYMKNYSTPKEVNGFLQLEKRSGVHAKSAEYYNQLIEKLGLTSRYEKINKNDRFRYFYIDDNNPYGIESIGFKDIYPKEFDKYFTINKYKMFEKIVCGPMKHFETNHKWAKFNPNNVLIGNQEGISVLDL